MVFGNVFSATDYKSFSLTQIQIHANANKDIKLIQTQKFAKTFALMVLDAKANAMMVTRWTTMDVTPNASYNMISYAT